MSLRLRLLLIVVLASVVPLLLVGLWLTDSARLSGERMLEERLNVALNETVALVTGQWVRQRSELLFVAEDAAVQRLLAGVPGTPAADPSRGTAPAVLPRRRSLDPGVLSIEVLDLEDQVVGSMEAAEDGDPSRVWQRGGMVLYIDLPVFERRSGIRAGALRVGMEPNLLMPLDRLPAMAAGTVITLVDASGRVLSPVPIQLPEGDADRFDWAGEEWSLVRRALEEPPVSLVAAATLGPALGPFRRTARQGTILLVAVTLLAIASTAGLTRRMTRSLVELSEAADAVAAGDLARRLPVQSNDEVGRVARAFNQMTDRLRRTMDRLAGRESLAAVGEFAAGLAHEVRNPLTAVQIDLQYVESELPADSPLLEAQRTALAEIRRLDSTVRDALRVARSGNVEMRSMDLRAPLQAAADAARPAFETRGATLALELPAEPLDLEGDPGALEQLFLNVMLNAGEALGDDGQARVRVERQEADILVTVEDDGPGIPASVRERIFEPLFSTRREGTGLGLPIAQRIALAHEGRIRIDSEEGRGTLVEVRLPAADAL